jgi:hypothetical protein
MSSGLLSECLQNQNSAKIFGIWTGPGWACLLFFVSESHRYSLNSYSKRQSEL